MPFRPHYRVTAIGQLGTSLEVFSYGINLAPQGGSGTAGGVGDTITWNAESWADVAEDVRAFHATVPNLSGRAVLQRVKVARIAASGKYDDLDPLIFDVTDTGGAEASDAVTVPQAAMAISLVTGRRGPSGKGRFYLPMISLPIGPDMRVSAAHAQNIATAAAAFLNNVNNAPGIDAADIKVCVASTKGYNTPVTGVRVGRVVDTIRTRRNKVPEAYGATVNVA